MTVAMRLTITIVNHVVGCSVHDNRQKHCVESEERLLSLEERDKIIKRFEPGGTTEETRKCENQREIDYKCNKYGFEFNFSHLLYHSAMFFAKAPACHHPERALPPLERPCCARRALCCHRPRRLLLRRHRRWNCYRRRRCIVWEKDSATPSRLEIEGVLTEAESGSLKLVHCCFGCLNHTREKSGELITLFLEGKHVMNMERYKKFVHIIK